MGYQDGQPEEHKKQPFDLGENITFLIFIALVFLIPILCQTCDK